MKFFNKRMFAVLLAVCMMFSLLPISALAAPDGTDSTQTTAPADGADGYSLTLDLGGTGVTWYTEDKAGTEIGDKGLAVPSTEITVDTDGETPTITVTTIAYVKADRGYQITELEEVAIKADGDPAEDEEQTTTFDADITDEGLEYCDLKVTFKFDGYVVEEKSVSVAIEINAESIYDFVLDIDGTGITLYTADEKGAEIGDKGFAIPATDIKVSSDDNGDVPAFSVSTTVYVKADRGYELIEGGDWDLVIKGSDKKDEDLRTTLKFEATDDGVEYCDFKVTVKIDGYAVKGTYLDIALKIDADPIYDFNLDIDGTGITLYARDEKGADIGEEGFAIPTTDIKMTSDGSGNVPAFSVSTTVYVKADQGYELIEGGTWDLVIEGSNKKVEDLHTTFNIEATDEGLKYCDLKLTVKIEGYAVKGTYLDIALKVDATPTPVTITAGNTKLDTSKFSTVSYADAEAIPYKVAYNADGTTVAVSAYVADSKDSIVIGDVVDGKPVYDDESHTGANAFVEVKPENTIDNPVYVAVWYIPDKTGAAEAKPYDQFFKIALYMEPKATISFTDVKSDDYFYPAVNWAVEKNVTVGMGDGTFGPSLDCTRAQFVTFLWRAARETPPTSTQNKFVDVTETAQAGYYDAILWGVEQGIISGTSDTTFNPNDPITRAQAVLLMYRYAQKEDIATKTGVETFDDVANEGDMTFYYDAIAWAQANGITQGKVANVTFGPWDKCDRGMMITFLYRLFEVAA